MGVLDTTTWILGATTLILLVAVFILYFKLKSTNRALASLAEKNNKYIKAIKDALVMAANCPHCGKLIKAYWQKKRDGKYHTRTSRRKGHDAG